MEGWSGTGMCVCCTCVHVCVCVCVHAHLTSVSTKYVMIQGGRNNFSSSHLTFDLTLPSHPFTSPSHFTLSPHHPTSPSHPTPPPQETLLADYPESRRVGSPEFNTQVADAFIRCTSWVSQKWCLCAFNHNTHTHTHTHVQDTLN